MDDREWIRQNVPPHGYYGIRRSQMPWGDSRPPAETAPPFMFADPGDHSFWQTHMLGEFAKYNCLVTMDENKNFIIRGDGVRLHVPYDYLVMAEEDALYVLICQGIQVSRKHRTQLGY
jgi:hypothetical protein